MTDYKTAFRYFAKGVSDHFEFFETEVATVVDDYSERVKAAEAGDTVAASKLLRYLRGCLISGSVPDEAVARWAAGCIFEITHHKVNADKAFSLTPENGRPSKDGNKGRALCIWEDVEVIRHTQGINKTEAIAAYQEQRKSLANVLWQQARETMNIEAETTVTRLYRQGGRIVKQYTKETGQKPPAF